MRIIIDTIPHNQQRYPTCGDWYWEPNPNDPDAVGTLHIKASEVSGDYRYSLLIAFHELAEALMCMNDGVDEEEVTKFDKRFEMMREVFPDVISADSEPGNQRLAPYKKQHARATELEKMLCKMFGIPWQKYDKAVNEL